MPQTKASTLLLLLLFFYYCTFITAVVVSNQNCPDQSDVIFEDVCFRFVKSTRPVTYDDAAQYCQQLNGNKTLAIITSKQQQLFLGNYLETNGWEDALIGLRLMKTPWKWVPPLLDKAPLWNPELSELTNQGCFGNARIDASNSKYSHQLTIQGCMAFCREKGKRYAGVQASTLCLCNDQLPSVREASLNCTLKCSGDQHQFCGNHRSIYIYNTFTDRQLFAENWDLSRPAMEGNCAASVIVDGQHSLWYDVACSTALQFICQFDRHLDTTGVFSSWPNNTVISSSIEKGYCTPESCFVLFPRVQLAFSAANKYCSRRAYGGRLVAIESTSTQVVVNRLVVAPLAKTSTTNHENRPIDKNFKFWIGATRREYQWPNGKALRPGYAAWAEDVEPTIAGHEKCVRMSSFEGAYRWKVRTCENYPTSTNFICSGSSSLIDDDVASKPLTASPRWNGNSREMRTHSSTQEIMTSKSQETTEILTSLDDEVSHLTTTIVPTTHTITIDQFFAEMLSTTRQTETTPIFTTTEEPATKTMSQGSTTARPSIASEAATTEAVTIVTATTTETATEASTKPSAATSSPSTVTSNVPSLSTASTTMATAMTTTTSELSTAMLTMPETTPPEETTATTTTTTVTSPIETTPPSTVGVTMAVKLNKRKFHHHQNSHETTMVVTDAVTAKKRASTRMITGDGKVVSKEVMEAVEDSPKSSEQRQTSAHFVRKLDEVMFVVFKEASSPSPEEFPTTPLVHPKTVKRQTMPISTSTVGRVRQQNLPSSTISEETTTTHSQSTTMEPDIGTTTMVNKNETEIAETTNVSTTTETTIADESQELKSSTQIETNVPANTTTGQPPLNTSTTSVAGETSSSLPPTSTSLESVQTTTTEQSSLGNDYVTTTALYRSHVVPLELKSSNAEVIRLLPLPEEIEEKQDNSKFSI